MSDSDPAYRGDCTDSVADYDYELAILQSRERQKLVADDAVPLQPKRVIPVNLILTVVAAIVLVVLIAGVSLYSFSPRRGVEGNNVATVPSWQDSATSEPTRDYPPPDPNPWPMQPANPTPDPLPPPLPLPDLTPPPPEAGPPALSPAPQSMCDTREDVQSYQAVPVEGPFAVLPGWYWVAGPENRPPRAVLPHRIGQWWNWKLIFGTANCHDFVLEPWRQK